MPVFALVKGRISDRYGTLKNSARQELLIAWLLVQVERGAPLLNPLG
jgi:hypothetical protein